MPRGDTMRRPPELAPGWSDRLPEQPLTLYGRPKGRPRVNDRLILTTVFNDGDWHTTDEVARQLDRTLVSVAGMLVRARRRGFLIHARGWGYRRA